MPRFKLIIEYDGAPFVGWQRQENGLSIQEALEEALAAMTAERATVHGAGRTDAGVHAQGQVAHVDLEREREPFRLGEGLNALLDPHPIAVLKSERVDSGFDARRSASARHYLYRIVNRRAPLALERGRAWRVKAPLDVRAMHDAAQALVGRHDFSTFRDAQCQAKSPIRTLDRLDACATATRCNRSERALVPASAGALDGRLAGRGRRGPVDRRRPQGRARSRRPQPLRPGRASGVELGEASEHDDWAWFAVIAGPAAEPCEDPCGEGERAGRVRVLLLGGFAFEALS